MRWKDGWPVMGDDAGPSPGMQWQWQSNPDPSWGSIVGGALRLSAVPAAEAGDTLWAAGHLLLQKLPAPAFVATTLVFARAPHGAAGTGSALFDWFRVERGEPR